MNPTGNTVLVDYGIQSEESDYRIHVCVEARRIYVFPTKSGQDAIRSGLYIERPVWTQGIVTATGYCVPPMDIVGCWWVSIPPDILGGSDIRQAVGTSAKGDAADLIARQMIARGLVVFPVQAEVVTGLDDQLRGLDGTVTNNVNYQVKCDYRGGHREFGGTGNLYLQVSECNPWGQH